MKPIPEVLYLGYQGPLTGDEASTGASQLNAVRYAIRLFNSLNEGKVEVKLVLIDDQGDPSIAAKIAPEIGADLKILGLVGPAYSGATIISLPFYQTGGLVLISPSATRESLTDPKSSQFGGPVFHRIASSESKQAPLLAKWATSGNSSAKVFIFNDQYSYTGPMADLLSKALLKIDGASVVGTESISDLARDFSPTIAKIKALGADVVMYIGFGGQAGLFIKQLRDSGSMATFAGSELLFSNNVSNNEFITLAGAASEGTRVTGTYGSGGLSVISTQLEADFKNQMGVSSGLYAVESFDATVVFLSGINSGIRTRSKMLEYVKSYRGTSLKGSPISFDINGNMIESHDLNFSIVNGKFTLEKANLFVDGILGNTDMGGEGLLRQLLATTALMELEKKAEMELAEATKKANEELRSIANKAADELFKLKFEADKVSIETKLAASKALLEASLIAERAMLDAKLKADKTVLEKIINEARAANERILADAKVAQEAAVKTAAELKAKAEAEAKAKAAALSKKITITCVKGKLTKKVTAVKPVCPAGFKKK